jgi:hypothetical protein
MTMSLTNHSDSNQRELVDAINTPPPSNAYDWVESMWSTPEKTMEILSVPPQSNPTRPGIPSLLVSVQQVQ